MTTDIDRARMAFRSAIEKYEKAEKRSGWYTKEHGDVRVVIGLHDIARAFEETND